MAQWLAYALPCRRFAPALADGNARLGADVVRYSFIVMDLHHLLLAGLPAHAKRSNPETGEQEGWIASSRARLAMTLNAREYLFRIRIVEIAVRPLILPGAA